MKPIRLGQLEESISSAHVAFEDTDEVRVLATRTKSACHFFDRFTVGEDEIQLRLDWSDLDCHGQPVLDADFIDRESGKHRALRGTRLGAHHTTSLPGEGRCYVWQFEDFSRKFRITVSWLASVVESANATDFCSAEVQSAANQRPEP